ncbi:hypothetical protein DERF_003664 [Dermatophagoides farinae]|uniref:Uncharacterized protein n=1 Tax=Dermatophagoides farinae TaxID=6954 RepID=A0A922IE25_DERFA|nr:hypothetical protein DERF_003664 [Dermatophagoides farinae]
MKTPKIYLYGYSIFKFIYHANDSCPDYNDGHHRHHLNNDQMQINCQKQKQKTLHLLIMMK